MSAGTPGRWRSVFLAVVIFVSGAVAGAAATIVTLRHRAQTAIRHPEQAPAKLARSIGKRLRLDASQEAAVRAVLARHQPALAGLRRGASPQAGAELEELRRDVAAVLTPQQAARWNRWFEQRRERWLPGSR